MGEYRVAYENNHVKSHLADIKKSGSQRDIKRVEKIFKELQKHPYTGIGSPEALKYELSGCWSRQINKKDRIIYMVDEIEKIVFILSAKGHYKDK